MKIKLKQISIIALLFLIQIANGQTPKKVSEKELEGFKQEILRQSNQLRTSLENLDYYNEFEKEIKIDFIVDTFMIENLISKRIDVDYSTNGMNTAVYDGELEYDKLLNKYYQILLNKLNDSDKVILRQSQRNWISYRDSERKLNSLVSNIEYSGGGTIQSNFIASRYFDITKERVLELFNYLLRFNIE